MIITLSEFSLNKSAVHWVYHVCKSLSVPVLRVIMIITLSEFSVTLILLFTTTPTFANNVDPDQIASEEAI